MNNDNQRLRSMREVELFRDIDPAELQIIAEKMQEQSFENREVVFREGDPGDRLFILLQGTMHVYVTRKSKVITYNRLQPGECFGEMALIENVPRSATVQADAPSMCLTLSRQEFLELLKNYPLVVLRLMQVLVPRLRSTNIQLQHYASQTRRAYSDDSRVGQRV